MLESESEGSTNDFMKTENKAKLWNLLQNHGAFNGISNTFFATVRKDFESIVVRINRENGDNTKMEKNKIFLDTMIQKMMEYRKQSYTQPHTADDIRQTKAVAFDNELAKKQADFNQYNAKPVTNSIEFKDKEDHANGSVNDLLEQAIRDRENLVMPPAPISKDTTDIGDTKNITVSTSPITSLASAEIARSDLNEIPTREILVKIMEKLEEIEIMIAKQ